MRISVNMTTSTRDVGRSELLPYTSGSPPVGGAMAGRRRPRGFHDILIRAFHMLRCSRDYLLQMITGIERLSALTCAFGGYRRSARQGNAGCMDCLVRTDGRNNRRPRLELDVSSAPAVAQLDNASVGVTTGSM
jgi:hypothetical protein